MTARRKGVNLFCNLILKTPLPHTINYNEAIRHPILKGERIIQDDEFQGLEII